MSTAVVDSETRSDLMQQVTALDAELARIGEVWARLFEARAAAMRALPYEAYLQTRHWRELRKQKLEGATNCQLCGHKPDGPYLDYEIHHVTYMRLGREELDDLLVLCKPCHKRHHQETT